jgi:diguanylate cyclase (GGDEF)-like protein
MHSRDRQLQALLELSGRTAGRARPELVGEALSCAVKLLEATGATAMLVQGKQTHSFALRPGCHAPESFEPHASAGALSRLLRFGRPILTPDLATDPRLGRDDGCPGLESGPALFMPLRLREQEPGYLAAFRRSGSPAFESHHIPLAALLGAWMATALDNQRLSEQVEKLAVTDDLTQVYNYRFLKTALRREMKRAARYRQDLSIIMMDVDNLKSYNDRHGHLRGSFLLRELARLISQMVRSWDLVAKYGGDEFTIILPQTSAEGAMAVAERLREGIERHAFPLAAPGQITISLGVASFPADGDSMTHLIAAADRALYRAKREGRNRAEVFSREVA